MNLERFWKGLRQIGLNPNPIHSETSPIPQFHDPDNSLSFLEPKTSEDLIDRWLEEHGRPFKYAYFVRVLEEGEEGLSAGIYCNTNIYPAEWQQSPMLRHAYSSIYTAGLVEQNYVRQGQHIFMTVSPYFLGEERYALLSASVIGTPLTTS